MIPIGFATESALTYGETSGAPSVGVPEAQLVARHEVGWKVPLSCRRIERQSSRRKEGVYGCVDKRDDYVTRIDAIDISYVRPCGAARGT